MHLHVHVRMRRPHLHIINHGILSPSPVFTVVGLVAAAELPQLRRCHLVVVVGYLIGTRQPSNQSKIVSQLGRYQATGKMCRPEVLPANIDEGLPLHEHCSIIGSNIELYASTNVGRGAPTEHLPYCSRRYSQHKIFLGYGICNLTPTHPTKFSEQ